MRKLNLGCGRSQPDGWFNVDIVDYGQEYVLDVLGERQALLDEWAHSFDVIVANHLLSCFSHWELVEHVLPLLHDLLAPKGTVRILVPDAELAVYAFINRDIGYFPQGDDMPGLDERFCTYLPWFGESKSIFTHGYLSDLLFEVGFNTISGALQCGEIRLGPLGSAVLDDRCVMSLIVEAQP